MATNTCSRTRRNFVKPGVIAEQYQIKKTKVYELLKMSEFRPAIKKISDRTIRVDQDKFYEILEELYG